MTADSATRAAIHAHHTQISDELAARLGALEARRPDADPSALVAFLEAELLPHAHGEERHLYPAVDPLIKAHGSATATMGVDHEFIEGYVARLGEAARALRAAQDTQSDEARALREAFVRLAIQLQAVLTVHLEKEERVYLPLFERYLSAAEQERILAAMHETGEHETGEHETGEHETGEHETGEHETGEHETGEHEAPAVETLDVRPLPPAQRHQRIFALFDALPAGGAFVLVNDHDPKPLRYQLLAERPGQLAWEYLEQGPAVWRVRLGRTSE